MSALAAELTLIDLGDQRLNRRVRRMLEKLGEKPFDAAPVLTEITFDRPPSKERV
jgi:hypothetical protein